MHHNIGWFYVWHSGICVLPPWYRHGAGDASNDGRPSAPRTGFGGLQQCPRAALRHRRLAILDLSLAGHQPMLSDDGEIGIVFNGCILQFPRIAGRIGSAREKFHSHCDTEVLLNGYRCWALMAWSAACAILGERTLEAAGVDGPFPSLESARYLLSELFAYQRRTYFTGEFLMKVDGATVHHGVEARSPLLDQELWEFAAALPFGLRLHRLRLKAVLREICRRRIGAQVARRKKQGFTIPVETLAGRSVDEEHSGFAWRYSIGA